MFFEREKLTVQSFQLLSDNRWRGLHQVHLAQILPLRFTKLQGRNDGRQSSPLNAILPQQFKCFNRFRIGVIVRNDIIQGVPGVAHFRSYAMVNHKPE